LAEMITSERCVTVLNQQSDKKMSPHQLSRLPPLQHLFVPYR
jgi:hypothetical protein